MNLGPFAFSFVMNDFTYYRERYSSISSSRPCFSDDRRESESETNLKR